MSEGENRSESKPMHCPGRVFAILNPKAGSAVGDAVRKALTGCMAGEGCQLVFHAIGPDDRIGALVRDRLAKGVDLVIAAGGDGTVSAVADALAVSNTPLGIIPMGTANVLARELNIPLDLHAASQLLVSEHDIRTIDAMRVNGRHYVTQLGVGLDAMMIRDTSTEQKRRFGKAAYVWTAFRGLAGIHPHRFTIEIDGKTIETRASQVIVANVGMLGQPPFRYGPDIRLDDGRLDVCVSKARHLFHYIGLFWHVVTSQHKADPNVRYFQAEDHVLIAPKHPLPVQADGEILGETPVRVDVVPGAIRVIVPKERSTST